MHTPRSSAVKSRLRTLPILGKRVGMGAGIAASAIALLALAVPGDANAQDARLDQAVESLEFREIGPAIMGGRIADLAVDPSNPSIFYIGYSIGGLWKTTSAGVEFEPIFDEQPNSSIGAVTVAPSNPHVIWVGTGEPQNRQSSPYGNGVYKSLDGGKTWEHMGLRDTRHTGRIVIHPSDSDIVYVAAVGQLSAPNEERGVFRTTDGGETWEKVLYLNEHTGAIDLVMHPTDPKTLFAAMYQRQRKPWGFSADGDGSGIYRTLDGGETWHELTEGLPEGYKGRIGLDVYQGDGNIVYALVESRGDGRGLYRSTDRGDTWEKMSDRNPRPMYFSLVRIDPNDPERIYLGGVSFSISEDGGRTWRQGDQADGIHVDHHAFWINPNNSNHLILGNDGGLAVSWDRGETWRHHTNMAVAQFYQIGLDNSDPYRICGGLQDNYSWCGPSQTRSNHGIMNRDWLAINGGDGFWNVPDPSDPDIIYTESQNGNVRRFHYSLGEAARVRPEPRPTPEDDDRDYRWNWNTPIHVSHHDPATVYVGANHLLRSRDRAMSWEEASPDVTRQVDRDTLEMMGMPVTRETLSRHDGTSDYGTIVEIGESPLNADVLYTGTDDAVLQVTRDGGATWTDITENVPGLVHGRVVSGIEPSYHSEGRVYIAYDGHWDSDYRPYVFVSEDFGESWTRIIDGLPEDGSVNVVREHPNAANLLFAGTEVGLWASFDRGASWEKLHGANFPTAPVDDIRIHPRENDLVVGTHGRAIWILDDITPLEQIARENVLASASHLFPVREATMWRRKGIFGFWGDGIFQAPNPPDGAMIRYWLAEDVGGDDEAGVVAADAADAVDGDIEGNGGGAADAPTGASDGFDGDGGADAARAGDAAVADHGAVGRTASSDRPDTMMNDAIQLQILDGTGSVVRTLDAPGEAGLQQVVWDFRTDPPYEAEGGGFRGGPRGPEVLPGRFTARLIVNEDTMTTPVSVRQDPYIDVSRADLIARRDAIQRINRLAEPLYLADQAMSELEDRIEAARELLEQSSDAQRDAVIEQLEALEERVEEVDDLLDDAGSGRSVLGSIDGVSAPPTADQVWQIERGEAAAPGAIEALNELLTERLPALEARIYQPPVRPEPIEPVELGTVR